MIFVGSGILLDLIAWVKGCFKNWRDYYPTVLYVIIGSMTSSLLLYKKLLWEFTCVFGQYMYLNILLMLLLYPGTVVLFLYYFPKKKSWAVFYIGLWSALYTVIESISVSLKIFAHHNGWNIYFSALHNVIMFLLVILHYKKPLLAWPASFLSAFLIVWYFNIPLEI